MLGTAKSGKRRGLGRCEVLAGALVATMCVPALGGPEGARVTRGQATLRRAGTLTEITASDNSIINFSSFDIGARESVRFIQPGATSRVLNRVLSPDPTRIDGTLTANGQVYLLNSSGIFFGNTAVVDVGALYAGAGHMSDMDFLRGVDRFTDLTGAVVNAGTILGDAVHLIGAQVANRGTILSDKGIVTMAAGDDVLIGEFEGNIYAKIEGAAASLKDGAAGVENSGTISAPGGTSLMAAGDVFALAIHNTGTIRASHVRMEGGAGGVVKVGGRIDASSAEPGRSGGSVEILGDRVGLVDARIDASGPGGGGRILIGGDKQGGGQTPTASRTYVGPTTRITADAGDSGGGGTVVVWADEVTRFYGQISARGGENAGDGGFVEVSGRDRLVYGGIVDTRAPGGRIGTLLLDPTDINVVAGAGETTTLTDVDMFADPDIGGDGATDLGVAALNGAASNVTLQATNDINFNTAVNVAGAGVGITAQAGNNINVNLSITTNGGFLNFTANDPASGGASGTGAITLVSGAPLATGGGNVTLSVSGGTGGISIADAVSVGAGNIVLEASAIALTGGAASISGTGTIDLRPFTATDAISIGTVGAPAPFDLDAVDIAALATGFSGITIGRADGQHAITIDTATFNDPVTIQTPVGGSITIAGVLATTGDNVTLDGSGATTVLGSNINTAGGSVTVSDSVRVSGAGRQINTGGGNIQIDGVIDGTTDVTDSLVLSAGAGDITLANRVGTGALGLLSLTMVANNLNLGGNIDANALTTVGVTGLVTLTSDVAITTTNTVDFTNSTGITGTTIGTESLTFNTSSVLLPAVGTPVALGGLSVTTSGTSTISGDISVDGGGPVDLTGVSAVNLTGPVTIDTDAAGGATGAGQILFNFGGTTNGAQGLVLRSSADGGGAAAGIQLGTLGDVTPLTGLTIDAGSAQVTLGGNVSVDGGGDADFSASTNLSLGGAVTIDTDAAGGASNAGQILFAAGGTTNGAQSLVLRSTADGGGANGMIQLGAVGTTTPLTDLTVDASTAQVSLNGNIDLDGGGIGLSMTGSRKVALGANVRIRTDTPGFGGVNAAPAQFAGAGNIDGAFTLEVDTRTEGGGTDSFIQMSTAGATTPLAGVTLRSGSGTTTLNGSISVDGGGSVDLSTASVVNLTNFGALTIDTDGVGGATDGGPILFAVGGTIDGARNLVLRSTADGGGFDGAIQLGTLGSATPLTAVTVDAGSATATLGGDVRVDGGGNADFSATPDLALGANSVIDTDATGGATNAGQALFAGAGVIRGPFNLTIDTTADGGGTSQNVTLPVIGETLAMAADPLKQLDVFAPVATIGGNISTDGGGGVDLTGVPSVSLTGPVTIDTDAVGGATGAGQILFNFGGTTNGAQNLVLRTSADGGGAAAGIQLGTLGDATPLTGLTVDAGSAQVTLGGNVSVDGGGNLDLSSSTNIALGANTVLDTDATGGVTNAGQALFAGAGVIRGPFNLTIDTTADGGGTSQNVTLPVIGETLAMAADPLKQLDVFAPVATLSGNISVDGGGNVDFSGVTDLVLAADSTIDTDATGGASNAGSVLFPGADPNGLDAAVNFAIDVTADGGGLDRTLSFGNLGAATPFTSINFNAGSMTLGSITTTGPITLASTDNTGVAAAGTRLGGDLMADGGAVTITGWARLDKVGTLAIDTAQASATAGMVDLSGATFSATAATNGLAIDTTAATTGGAVSLGLFGGADPGLTVLEQFAALISATTTGGGVIGGGDDGTITLTQNITTDGGPVTLVNNTIVGTSTLTIDTEIGSDTVAGDISIGFDPGSMTPSSVSASATGTDLLLITQSNAGGGNVNLGTFDNAGGQYLRSLSVATNSTGVPGVLSLGGSISLDAAGAAAGTLTFTQVDQVNLKTGIVIDTEVGGDDAAADVRFNPSGNIDGAQTLSILTDSAGGDGTVDLGTVGATTPLTGLTVNAGAGTVTLSGDLLVGSGGSIDLSSSTDVNLDSAITSAITLSTDDGVAAAGNITLASGGNVDGAVDLTIDAKAAAGSGTVQLGNMGQSTPLTSLNVDTPTTTISSTVDTTGAIDISDALTIGPGASAIFRSTTGTVAIHGAVSGTADGVESLRASSTSGDVRLESTVGSVGTRLATLTVGTSGTVFFGGDVHAISIDGSGVTGGATLLNTLTMNSSGAVDFSNVGPTMGISALADGAQSLTINDAGGTVSLGAVGITRLGGLTITGATINLGGTIAVTGGGANLTGTTNLGSNISADGGAVTVTGALNLSSSLFIDTEQSGLGNAGAVDLSGATVSATVPGVVLTLRSSTFAVGFNGGAVSLGTFDSSGGSFINGVTVEADGGAGGTGGTLSLSGPIALDNAGAGPADLFFTGDGDVIVSAAGVSIDTEDGNDETAGSISFSAGNSLLRASGPGLSLTLDTSSIGDHGGDQILGDIGQGAGSFLGSLTLDSRGSAADHSKDGTIRLRDSLSGANGEANVDVDGPITFRGHVLGEPGGGAPIVRIDSEQGDDAAGNAIDLRDAGFSSAAGGSTRLFINASTAAVGLNGGAVHLGLINDLDPDALATMTPSTFFFFTGVTVDTSAGAGGVGGTLTLHDSISIDGGMDLDFTAVDSVVLAAPVTLTTAPKATAVGGGALFGAGSTLDGAFALTIDTGSAAFTDGDVVFGNVGSTTPLSSLTIDQAKDVTFNGPTTVTGALTQTAGTGSTIFMGATSAGSFDVNTTTLIDVQGPLAATTGDASFRAGEIDFTGGAGTVSGMGMLTLRPLIGSDAVAVGSAAAVDAAGRLDLNATDLGALANGFSQITIGSAAGSGPMTIGAAAFADPVLFLKGTSGGGMQIDGPLTGSDDAAFTFTTSGVLDLATIAGDVSTTGGDIAFTFVTSLGAGASPTLGTGAGGGDVIFGGALGAPGAGAESLTINSGTGAISFAGTIGADAFPLGTLDLNGSGLATFTGDVVAGTIDVAGLTGGVRLAATTAFKSTNTLVDFSNSTGINASAAGMEELSISSGSGGANLPAVGTGTALGSVVISTTGTVGLSGNVSTDADAGASGNFEIQQSPAARLDADVVIDTDANANATGGSILMASAAVNADAPATNRSLTLSSPTAIGLGTVGDSLAPGTLDLNTPGTLSLFGDVTAGTIDATGVTGDVLLGTSLTLASTNTLIDFAGATGGIRGFGGGGQVLTITSGTGGVSLPEIGLGGGPLGGLSVTTSGPTSLGADITTDAIGVASGAVSIAGGGATTIAAGGVAINTDANTDANGGLIDLSGTSVNGAAAFSLLAADGGISLGTIGDATPPTSLTLTTSGTTDLGGSVSADSIDSTGLTGPVIVSGASAALTTMSTLDLSGTMGVDASDAGAHTLSIDAGAIVLPGVGQSQLLTMLGLTSAGTTTLNGNVTAGTVDVSGLTGAVVLGSGLLSISSTDTDINFGNATGIDATSAGVETLTINAGAGLLTLPDVGMTARLGGLGLNTTGGLTMTGSIDTTTAGGGSGVFSVTGGGPVTLGADLSIDTLGAGTGAPINFGTSSILGPARALTLTAGAGDVTLNAVGTSGGPLASLAITSSGSTSLFGDVTSGTIDFAGVTGGVILGSTLGLTSTNTPINFANATGGIRGFGAGGQTLTISTGTGDVSLPAVGLGGGPLGGISVDSTGTTTLGGDITTDAIGAGTGAVTITGGSTLLAGSVTVNTDAGTDGTGGPIDLSATSVDGPFGLSLLSADGGIRLAAVGQSTSLASLILATSGPTDLGGNVSANTISAGGLTGAVDVSGADVTVTTTSVLSFGAATGLDASGAGTHVLSLDAGGLFLPPVGQNQAFNTLTLTTSGTTTLGGSVTAGAIDATGLSGGIVIGDTLSLTTTNTLLDLSAATGIDSDGVGVDGLTISTGSGDVSLPAVGASMPPGLLDVQTTGTATLNGPVVVDGGVVDLGQPRSLVYVGDLSIASGGGDVTIGSAGSSVSGTGAFSIAAGTGDVTIATPLGAGATRPASLSIAGATVTLTDVTTVGSQSVTGTTIINLGSTYASVGQPILFTGSVRLMGDVTLTTVLDGAAGADAAINGSVTGSHDLLLTTGTGLARFGGAIGSAPGAPLAGSPTRLETRGAGTQFQGTASSIRIAGPVLLDSDGQPSPPPGATIVRDSDPGGLADAIADDLTIEGTRIVMGPNAKLLSLGAATLSVTGGVPFSDPDGSLSTATPSLTGDEGGLIVIGDLTAVGDINVTGPRILIRTRSSGQTPARVGGTISSTLTVADLNTDFVSGGGIFFAGSVDLFGPAPSGFLQFLTPSGDVTPSLIGTIGELRLLQAGQKIDRDTLVLSSVAPPLFADVSGSGLTSENPSEAIAGAVPKETQSAEVPEGTTPNESQREDLRQIYIFARDESPEQRLEDLLVGRSLYVDVPRKLEPEAADFRVTASRLPGDAVEALLRTYHQLYWTQIVDENGQTQQRSRSPEVRERFSQAREAFMDESGGAFDPVAFRAFLDSSPDHAEAARDMGLLEEVLTELADLGLTSREMSGPRQQLISLVKPDSMSSEELEQTARAGGHAPSAQVAPDQEPIEMPGNEDQPLEAEPKVIEPAPFSSENEPDESPDGGGSTRDRGAA